MKTVTSKAKALITAITFSLLLTAQTPASYVKGDLTNSNTKKLNSTTAIQMKAKTDKSIIFVTSMTSRKGDKSVDALLQSELNSITSQISETVKFRPASKVTNESGNEIEVSLNAITEKIGEGVKYQPVSSL